MERRHKKLWSLALPYLKKGIRKDFVVHTKGVAKAMETLLKKEGGDPSILIPAAILHDVGWSKVPVRMQKSWMNKREKMVGEKRHLAYAPVIIEEILKKAGYDEKGIKRIIEIVLSHKFKKPKDHNKQMLVDADNLTDSFKEQFYSDAKIYKVVPEVNYGWRIKNNKFYTKTAREIFEKEMKKRLKELKTKK